MTKFCAKTNNIFNIKVKIPQKKTINTNKKGNDTKLEPITSLKQLIKNILEEQPICRNSDLYLYYEVCHFFGAYTEDEIKNLKIPLSSVIRIRQKFQQQGKYQADEQVQEWRSNRKDLFHKLNDVM